MILEFNQSKFLTLFSNINDLYIKGKISDEYLTEKFAVICQMLGNKENSVIPYDTEKNILDRERLFFYALCHLITLENQDYTGRVASASQGSVSTSFDLLKGGNFTKDFWAQTQCGSIFYMQFQAYTKGGRLYHSYNYHPFG